MKAWLLQKTTNLTLNPEPLKLVDYPTPEPKHGEVRVKVLTCGVCHTELDEIEGRAPPPHLPMILGHQAIGLIDQVGSDVPSSKLGKRVGIAWIFSSCNQCRWCQTGRENLCPDFIATGRDVHGGYAEYIVVPVESTFQIPEGFTDIEAAPMLCAGAIGYRSLRLAQLQSGVPLGLTGFGASAHLMLQMVLFQYPEIPVFVFARNQEERRFALDLGAAWAGESHEQAPSLMQSIIDTTPAWGPVVDALRQIEPGGRLIINAIRKEDKDKQTLTDISYPRDLWMEKTIQSVANVSRADVEAFLKLASEIPLHPTVEEFNFLEANRALLELKERKIRGAKVLRVSHE